MIGALLGCAVEVEGRRDSQDRPLTSTPNSRRWRTRVASTPRRSSTAGPRRLWWCSGGGGGAL